MSTKNVIYLIPVAKFAEAISVAKRNISAGIDEENALVIAFELAGTIRSMSRDEAWKGACNRFRDAFRKRKSAGGELSPAAVAAFGDRMLADLPNDTRLEPLDFWPRQPQTSN